MNIQQNRYNKVIKFYQLLPPELIQELLNTLIPNLNRKIKRQLKISDAQISDTNSLIAELLRPETQGIFVDTAYSIIKDKISFTFESTDYNQFIASYNDENKYYNTMFFFKWCLVNRDLYFNEFVDSELFDKILNGESVELALPSSSIDEIQMDFPKDDYDTIVKPIEQTKEVHSMKLLGRIEKRNNYFNFFPQYEYVNGRYEEINRSRLKKDFPAIGGINLSYTFKGRSDTFLGYEISADLDTDPFVKSIYLANINDDDIEDNDDYSGTYLQKIDLEKLHQNGKHLNDVVQNVEGLNIYKVVTNESTMPIDFTSRFILLKESNMLVEGESVVLFYRNRYYGPFSVSFRSQDGKFYINTDAKENNYLVPFYLASSVTHLEFEKQARFEELHITKYVYINGDSLLEDVITDDILLETIVDDISLDLAIESPEEFAHKCRNSPFFSKSEFSENRIKRLLEIVGKADEYSKQRRGIFDSLFSDYVSEQQVKETDWYKDLQSEKDSLNVKQEEKEKELSTALAEIEALKKKIEVLSTTRTDVAPPEKIQELEKEKRTIQEELDKTKEIIETVESIEQLKKEKTQLEGIRDYLDEENKKLKGEQEQLKKRAETVDVEVRNAIKKGFDDAASVAFEPYIAGKMLEVAAQENTRTEDNKYFEIHNRLEHINASELQGNDLIDYIVKYVQSQREYDYNDIVNIYICVALNFITVFSGEPGTGKTSMCNIIAKSLGLLNYGDDNINRYVSISVEKGWSSKRDLIGYYNPLTRRYDKNNSRLYDALRILDLEKDHSVYPFLIMLDEANLSPMEYYWADFMRLTDRSSINDKMINIGLENDIFIPETLHYLATINTDQTTEKLSPRLIDRACIIRLPKVKVKDMTDDNIPEIEIITWNNYIEAFTSKDDTQYIQSTNKILEKIYSLFEKYGMNISPRIQKIIKNYIISAEKIMVENNGANKTQVAIDYAIVQKLLPKINGHYDFLKNFFDNLQTLCKEYHLNLTNAAIEQIVESQDRNMGYCQYLI